VASWNLQVVNAAALGRFSPWFLILAENPFSRFDLQSLDYCPQDGGFLSSSLLESRLFREEDLHLISSSNIILS